MRDTLSPEIGKRGAQLIICRRNEGAHVDVTNALTTIIDDPHAITRRQWSDIIVRLCHRYIPRAARVGNAQHPACAHRAWSKRARDTTCSLRGDDISDGR